jgi:phosphate transport system protein
MNEMINGHTVQRFNQEMGRLHDLVLKIADLVREQLRNAVRTMEEEDNDAARQVIERDKVVNDLDVEADDEIIHLIAKRQPMAKDLREILTVGKIVTDLERVGDEARKIARLTIHFYDNDMPAPNNQIVLDIIKMAQFVDVMLDKAIRSYNDLDLNLAVEVIRMDLEIEQEFNSAMRRLSTFVMEDCRTVGHVVETVLGLRALERIGGHAKNIAGYVVFLVKGTDVRHEDLATVAAEVQAGN